MPMASRHQDCTGPNFSVLRWYCNFLTLSKIFIVIMPVKPRVSDILFFEVVMQGDLISDLEEVSEGKLAKDTRSPSSLPLSSSSNSLHLPKISVTSIVCSTKSRHNRVLESPPFSVCAWLSEHTSGTLLEHLSNNCFSNKRIFVDKFLVRSS